MALTLVINPVAQTLARQINRATLNQWAPIPLRLIVGYGFIAHGYAKLSRGPETFAVVLHAIGVPFPYLMAWLTTLVELIGGFAVSDWRLRTRCKPANDDRVADRYVHDSSAVWVFFGEAPRGNGKRDKIWSCGIRNYPALPDEPDRTCIRRRRSALSRSMA